MISLEIHQARREDSFQNIIRLHEDKINELGLQKHGIIRIRRTDNKKRIYGWLRTIESEDIERINEHKKEKTEWILMDESIRGRLCTSHHESLNFDIKEANKAEYINYYGEHSNPAVKIGFWMAIWLTFFSILIGEIIGIMSI